MKSLAHQSKKSAPGSNFEVIAVTNENESEDETSDENEATDEEDFVGKAQVPVVTRTSRRAAQYLFSSAVFLL